MFNEVIPRLRALCLERNINFFVVDMKSAFTEENVANGSLIEACLEEVDQCRP